MPYTVLARKYRPQRFRDLVGQETTAKILQAAAETGRISHGYIFSGPKGTGKTTTARIFAKILNCQKKDPKNSQEPCGECSSCKEITLGNSLDVMEIDAASHTKVEETRQAVIETVAFAPVRDTYKIFVIDEVHMFSKQSFNALLKTLEEPPAHVIFIFCTTEYHKIPETIVSRCQRFRFLPLSHKQILACLKEIAHKEGITIGEEPLILIARHASGSMRDALSLLDQVISQASQSLDTAMVEETLGVVKEELLLGFLRAVAEKNSREALDCIGKVVLGGYDLSYFLREVRECFREMLIEKCGYRDADAVPRSKSKLPSDRFTLAELLRDVQLLSKCADQMRWNDFPRMVFECYSVWLCQETIGVEEILGSLDGSRRLAAEPAILKPSEPKDTVARVEPKAESHDGADWSQTWKQLIASVRESRPSLSEALEMASVQFKENGIELSFSKPFWMDNLKRNLEFIEEALRKLSDRKITLSLKLGNPAVASAASGLDQSGGAALEGDEASGEIVVGEKEAEEGGEVFQVVEDSPDPKNGPPVEDEGLKNFLSFFPGRLARLPANSGQGAGSST